MMLGERIGAEQAEQWGMVYKTVEDAALANEADALALKLANGPTRAYAMIRQAIRASLECSLTEALHIERWNQLQAGRTEDFKEGVGSSLRHCSRDSRRKARRFSRRSRKDDPSETGIRGSGTTGPLAPSFAPIVISDRT
jgi:enoyl-CoA hydratase/carnithine racemase